MTLTDAAHRFRIPLQDLKWMQAKGSISEPLTRQDINNLAFLSYFWGKSFSLRRQLRHLSPKERKALVTTGEYSTIEAFIFNRYYHARKGIRMSAKETAHAVNYYYKIPITPRLMRTIYTLRRKAADARYYQKKKKRNSQNHEHSENRRLSKKRKENKQRSLLSYKRAGFDIFG